MPRQAQPQNVVTRSMQPLSRLAQTVWRIRHAMNQQNRALGGRVVQLEAAVPVPVPALRIRQTATMEAVDHRAIRGRSFLVDQFIQLLEEALFQLEIRLECIDTDICCEFLVEINRMPDLKVRTTVQLDDENDQQYEYCAKYAVNGCHQHVPGHAMQSESHELWCSRVNKYYKG